MTINMRTKKLKSCRNLNLIQIKIINLFQFISTKKSLYKDLENRPKFGPLEHNFFSPK